MLKTLFNGVATYPDDVPYHDGETHLIIHAHAVTTPLMERRLVALASAITQAGGQPQFIENPYDYLYMRDTFTLVGGTAYHPHYFDSPTQEFLHLQKFIRHYGYKTCDIRQPADIGLDGGNFIHVKQHDLLLTSFIEFYNDSQEENRAKAFIARRHGLHYLNMEATTRHIDTAVSVLPDGRLLVKLDETDEIDRLAQTEAENPYLTLTGIKPRSIDRLAYLIGKKNILTFSMFPHSYSNVVCSMEETTSTKSAAHAFGLMANGIVVNDTFIGESLPTRLWQRLHADGIKTLSPRDFGEERFAMADEGFVGAARCLTLEVRHQTPSAF